MTPLPDERRALPRNDVLKNLSRIQFDAPEGTRMVGATLININRNGALLIADEPMLRAVSISVRIESPVMTDWVDANVVRYDRNREMGLQFPQGCPDDLLLAATAGIRTASLARLRANETITSN